MKWTRDSLIRDLGQLFIMAFDGRKMAPEVVEFLATFRIGGVILFSDNYTNPSQLSKLINELQTRCSRPKQPLFIATDHEGGRVQRFVNGFTRIPPMADLGARSPAATEEIHRTMARELSQVGVNLNLTPVADLCGRTHAGAIGDRAFGTQPGLVGEHVGAAVRALQSEGVIACVKHFPGHGATETDSHRDLPSIQVERETMNQRELVPFRSAIDAGVEAVMTAHATFPTAGEPHLPASLSAYWIREVLRRDLGFDKLVITDALEMKALRDRWSPAACGFQSLQAGSDIVLYYREAFQFRAFWEIRNAVQRGELEHASLARSLERVRRIKEKYLYG